MAAWDDLPAAGGLGECAALVRSAEALRFSAPELAVQLARRALASAAPGTAPGQAGRPPVSGPVDPSGEPARAPNAGEADALSTRAHAVLASSLVRVSHYADAVGPAFAALDRAEGDGLAELTVSLRLDLAACAREVGEPLLGCAVLRPVLEAAHPEPSVRAIALGRLVGCIGHVGRRDDVEDVLAEAERLLVSDDGLSQDAVRLERARLSVRAAAYHRWYGDTEDAVESAREGLGQLNRLPGRRPETDRVRAQLVLELVCALLDEGELGEAEEASAAVLAEPARAMSAAAVGQLMLAVSTRVHLPSGRVGRGRGLLDEAVSMADRHGLDGLLVDALTAVSELDEHAGSTDDALGALRTARAAEQRKQRATARAARQILVVVGTATDGDPADAMALLRAAGAPVRPHTSPMRSLTPAPDRAPVRALRSPDPDPPGDTDAVTGLLNRDGLFRRLRAVRNGERPVALTLVRLTETGTRTNVDLTALAGRVRDLAPDHAELAHSDGGELAVLLPHTTRDQAEELAQSIRRTAIESNWLTQANAKGISTGVGQSNPEAPSVDAKALLTAARHALTSAADSSRRPGERTQPFQSTAPTAKALSELDDADDTLRIGRSIISSLSIPAGSGGRRRAQSSTDEAPWPDQTAPQAQPPHPTTSRAPHASAPPPPETLPTQSSGAPTQDAVSAHLARSSSFGGLAPRTSPPVSVGPSDGEPAGSGVSAREGVAESASAVPTESGGAAQAPFGDRAGTGYRSRRRARDQHQDWSESARHAASPAVPDVLPNAPEAAPTTSDGAGSPSEAVAEPTPLSPRAEPARPVGETGGYRPLLPLPPEQDQDQPNTEPERNPAPSGRGSAYERTRAELAHLMSVLESGSIPGDMESAVNESAVNVDQGTGSAPADARPVTPATPDAGIDASHTSEDEPGTGSAPLADGRWSFAPVGSSASLAAPTRAGDDAFTVGAAPTPPDPVDPPEPGSRPEVPDPGDGSASTSTNPPGASDTPDASTANGPGIESIPGIAAVVSGLGSSWEASTAGRASGDVGGANGWSVLGDARVTGARDDAVDEVDAVGALPVLAATGTEVTSVLGDTGDGAVAMSRGDGVRRERRGERSDSSTIAGLLAEALAAFQETTRDDQATSSAAGGAEPSRHQASGGSESSSGRASDDVASLTRGDSANASRPQADGVAAPGPQIGGYAESLSQVADEAVSRQGTGDGDVESRSPVDGTTMARHRAGGDAGELRDSAGDGAGAQPTVDSDGKSPPGRGLGVGDGEFSGFDRLFDWRYQAPASGRHRSPE